MRIPIVNGVLCFRCHVKHSGMTSELTLRNICDTAQYNLLASAARFWNVQYWVHTLFVAGMHLATETAAPLLLLDMLWHCSISRLQCRRHVWCTYILRASHGDDIRSNVGGTRAWHSYYAYLSLAEELRVVSNLIWCRVYEHTHTHMIPN